MKELMTRIMTFIEVITVMEQTTPNDQEFGAKIRILLKQLNK
jgi:hypothetical protein